MAEEGVGKRYSRLEEGKTEEKEKPMYIIYFRDGALISERIPVTEKHKVKATVVDSRTVVIETPSRKLEAKLDYDVDPNNVLILYTDRDPVHGIGFVGEIYAIVHLKWRTHLDDKFVIRLDIHAK